MNSGHIHIIRLLCTILLLVSFCGITKAQCSNYTISISAGLWPFEVSWSLVNSSNVSVASGGAPYASVVCLPPGCYTMQLFDSYGDGWNGSVFSVISAGVTVASGTLIDGSYTTQQFPLGGGNCNPPISCPPGQTAYYFSVSSGSWPSEVSWTITLNGSSVLNGFAPFNNTGICLSPGCYVLNMTDSWGDGWNGSTYNLTDATGISLYSGTLNAGYSGIAAFSIAGGDCSQYAPITASDCIDAVNVCENLNFVIDPNGNGLINEVPTVGTVSNPAYYPWDGIASPWGTDNSGCLMNGELNSTWMVINIWGTGWLEFTFGGMGMQVGYYDWIMWPYDPDNTCQDIYNNILPPVRCNWNATSVGGTGLAATIPPGGNAGNYEPPLWVNAGEQYLICFSNWSSVSTNVPLDFGGTAIVSCLEVLLPVEWLSFTGILSGENVELTWETASETNSDFFDVESSMDKSSWETIGQVDAAGNSDSKISYQFVDTSPKLGTTYYRLKQVDLNGEFSYSIIVDVFSGSNSMSVFPNPATGEFSLYTSAAKASDIQIRSMRGKLLSVELSAADDLGTIWTIDLSHFQNGIYTIYNLADPGTIGRILIQK